MSYWASIPNCIRKSKKLSAEEKETYYSLQERLNVGGWCEPTNKELAEELNVSENTIVNRLASLKEKGFIWSKFNVHSHHRRIYLNPPIVSEEEKPSDENLKEQTSILQNAWKKVILVDEVVPETLIERLQETNFLERIKDHRKQLFLDIEQIKFLTKFAMLDKEIDCQVAYYSNVDYQRLYEAIKESEFLYKSKNLSLKWCLENSEKIINGTYKSSLFYPIEDVKKRKVNFKEREYTRDELNSLFQDIDEIEI